MLSFEVFSKKCISKENFERSYWHVPSSDYQSSFEENEKSANACVFQFR